MGEGIIEANTGGLRSEVIPYIDDADSNLKTAKERIDGIQGEPGIGRPAELSSISDAISNIRDALRSTGKEILRVADSVDRADADAASRGNGLGTSSIPHMGSSGGGGGSSGGGDTEVGDLNDNSTDQKITEKNLELAIEKTKESMKNFFKSHSEFGVTDSEVDAALGRVKLATTPAEWELICKQYGYDPNSTVAFNSEGDIWLSPNATLEFLEHERSS